MKDEDTADAEKEVERKQKEIAKQENEMQKDIKTIAKVKKVAEEQGVSEEELLNSPYNGVGSSKTGATGSKFGTAMTGSGTAMTGSGTAFSGTSGISGATGATGAIGSKYGTGSTGPSSEASTQIGDIDVLKEHGARRARGSIITGSRYDPLVRVGSSTTGGVEPNIANELAEEKKLIMQDKSFVGLGNLIPKETLKASTYVPATGATGAASGAVA